MFPIKRILALPMSIIQLPPIRTSTANRQSRILRKLVTGKDRAKRRWFQDTEDVPKMQSASSLSNAKRQGKSAPRRVHVLNKLFMQHITDLMSTGEVSETILGRGLEISHVKVTPCFQYVNVFWMAKGSAESDANMEQILRKASGIIRHELSQLKVMGEVPKINFVKDRLQSKFAEVEHLLARADFGEDYEPSSWAQLKQDMVPHLAGCTETLPPMRHDVLGLDQRDIMEKIKRTMSKSRQAWQAYETRNITNVTTTSLTDDIGKVLPSRSMQEEITKLRGEEFAKFLERRQYLRKTTRTRKNPDFREYYDRGQYDDEEEFVKFDTIEDFLDDDDGIR